MNLTPIYDRVIIKIDSHQNQKSSGGIFVPITENAKTQTGYIVKIGIGTLSKDSKTVVPPIVKVGQKATFSSYAAIPIVREDISESYVCIRESDILFVEE